MTRITAYGSYEMKRCCVEAYDLIVVGAGAAGLTAAISAGEAGARVLVIEAAGEIGGTFHLSSGQMSAAGTRLQAARGIVDSPDAHYADVMRICRNTANPILVRLAVEHAADTLHWLLDHGLEVMPDHPVIHYGHEPYTIPRTYWGSKGGRSVLDVLEPLFDAQVSSGRVTLRLSSKATNLHQDHEGRVIGVEYQSAGGTAALATAPATLMTTGGYSANAELFPSLSSGKPLHGGGYAYSQGEGLRLVEAVGGRLINRDKFLPTFAGVAEPTAPGGVTILTQTYPQHRKPWELYVDPDGRRFMREDENSVDCRERSLFGLPGLTFWSVYDQAILEAAPPLFTGLEPKEAQSRFNRVPGYVSAQSVEALATAMGVPASNLGAAVDAFNLSQQTGAADPFGREHRPLPVTRPPFFAVRHYGWSIVGFAGVEVDGSLKVLHHTGRVIEGLYAAGEMLGLGATSGNAFVGGMSVTPAMTFGRLLGRRLAEASADLRLAPRPAARMYNRTH